MGGKPRVTRPLEWANASIAYGHQAVTAVRAINHSLRALADDTIAREHGCDTGFLGLLVALAQLAEPVRQTRVATAQLDEWRATYDGWFERRGFRSERARQHREAVHRLLDELRPKTTGAPRDFWIREAWLNGHPPRD